MIQLAETLEDYTAGRDYPRPIVDHKAARETALEAYKGIKGG